MKSLISGLAIVAILIWSLVAWAGHGLLGFAGRLFSENADLAPVPPETVVALSGWSAFLAELGQGAVAVVWGIGVLFILALAALARALAPRPSPQPQPDLSADRDLGTGARPTRQIDLAANRPGEGPPRRH